jgi:hypothetical protein
MADVGQLSREAAMLFRHILVALVLAAIAGVVVVPFVIGYVRGPQAGQAKSGPRAPGDPMRPLSRVAGIYGRFLLLYLVAAAFQASYGFSPGSTRLSVCVDSGYPYNGAAHGFAARPGASLSVRGDVTACARHASLGQWVLFLLTKVPELVLWACLLLLIWRLISEAARRGPFTPRAAGIVWLLGWTVIVGSYIASALSHLGADLLSRALMTPSTYFGAGIAVDVVFGSLKALLPVPALAGAALLTFARITRIGVVLDDEIKATV